jgi:hypothetical protein
MDADGRNGGMPVWFALCVIFLIVFIVVAAIVYGLPVPAHAIQQPLLLLIPLSLAGIVTAVAGFVLIRLRG